jgi:hypothetical protein
MGQIPQLGPKKMSLHPTICAKPNNLRDIRYIIRSMAFQILKLRTFPTGYTYVLRMLTAYMLLR